MARTKWWSRSLRSAWPPERPRAIKPGWWRVCLDSKGHCEYCGLDATPDARLLALLEGDHIVPRSRGGSENPLNYAMACSVCNELKKGYDPSLGKGSPRTRRDRRLLVEKTRAELARLASQRSLDEFPMFLRVWQLALRPPKKKGRSTHK